MLNLLTTFIPQPIQFNCLPNMTISRFLSHCISATINHNHTGYSRICYSARTTTSEESILSSFQAITLELRTDYCPLPTKESTLSSFQAISLELHTYYCPLRTGLVNFFVTLLCKHQSIIQIGVRYNTCTSLLFQYFATFFLQNKLSYQACKQLAWSSVQTTTPFEQVLWLLCFVLAVGYCVFLLHIIWDPLFLGRVGHFLPHPALQTQAIIQNGEEIMQAYAASVVDQMFSFIILGARVREPNNQFYTIVKFVLRPDLEEEALHILRRRKEERRNMQQPVTLNIR